MIIIEGIKFYTAAEVAKILGITPTTVRAYIRDNKLPAQRIGRSLLITEGNLLEFLKPSLPLISKAV